MLIRYMCESDIPSVYELECKIFSKPWSSKSFCDAIIDKNNIYLIVEKDEEIIGYCGLWGVVGEGQITNVAIKYNYRAQGIGRSMLSKLLEYGKTKGLDRFTLEVRASNQSAIHLYHSLGFKDAGVRKNYYEEPVEDGIIMWL